MDTKVVRFIDALRDAGVRVSLSENLDCLSALELTGLSEKATFRATLATTLVKQSRDMPLFDKLFALYFDEQGSVEQTLRGDDAEPENQFGEMPMQDFLEQLMREHPDQFERIQDFMQQIEPGKFQLFMQEQQEQTGFGDIQNPLQVGFFTRKVRENMDWGALEEDVESLKEELRNQGFSEQEIERIAEYLERQMQRFLEAVKQMIRQELEKNQVQPLDINATDELLNKSFYQLNQREMEVLREAVTKLGRKLRDKLILRHKRLSRGILDVRRTIRENMQYGGVPIDVHFRKKRREKPEIVAIVDISDSVGHVARFMLQFVYTIQDFFAKVRTYVFVSQLGEVTDLFHEHELQQAIEQALHSKSVDYYGHSNFGQAFQTFHDRFLDAVTPRTTVIIIGDARNNRFDPKVWALKGVQEKAKRVIWLNPESKAGWRLGDSVMHDYIPYCDEVYECRNAKQLLDVVDSLVKK